MVVEIILAASRVAPSCLDVEVGILSKEQSLWEIEMSVLYALFSWASISPSHVALGLFLEFIEKLNFMIWFVFLFPLLDKDYLYTCV